MNKLKNVVLGGLIAGTLLASVGPALAIDRGWGYQNQRYENRGEFRGDYARLQQARAKLEYDLRHHASRRRLAQDQAAIQAILDDIQRDRRDNRHVYRDRDDRHRD
jgi:hypothetical protein